MVIGENRILNLFSILEYWVAAGLVTKHGCCLQWAVNARINSTVDTVADTVRPISFCILNMLLDTTSKWADLRETHLSQTNNTSMDRISAGGDKGDYEGERVRE